MDGTRSRKSEVIWFALDALDPKRYMTAVMVGDREHDIIGANEVGIDSFGVMWGYGSKDEFKQAKATDIAETPDDLYKLIIGKDKL